VPKLSKEKLKARRVTVTVSAKPSKMGNFQFIPRSTIHETIQDLDYFSGMLIRENMRQDKQEALIEEVTLIIEKYKEHIKVNASSYKTPEEIHVDIAKLCTQPVIKKYQIENRELAIDILEKAFETLTKKPYEVDEKIMYKVSLTTRLEYINSELPYLKRKQYDPFAAPEMANSFERFTKEKQRILSELSAL
jgi:hypothetical protein